MQLVNNKLQESFEDFFEESLCGFIITDTQGLIVRANKKLASWQGSTPGELKGIRFSDILTIGGKVFYETHLWPLLRMQGFFDEVMLEIRTTSGSKLQVLVNAIERRHANDSPSFIRFTLLKCSDRLLYEQNLRDAKINSDKELINQKANVLLREQLIAVLGHDLRNPLTSISMATQLLEETVDENNAEFITIIKGSAARMKELINNIMDFARTRLGEGIILNRKEVFIKPVIDQVISEIQISSPQREIITNYNITEPVNCDPHRIAQLLSNLISNAFTHGAPTSPVTINVLHKHNLLEISVCNKGEPISEEMREQIFQPFAKERVRASRQGLGLGLYICAEIAHAHNGTLKFTSYLEETCFQFKMQS